MEIAVRTNGAAVFTTLSPRQILTPTPYALYARNAGNALLLDGQSPTAYAPATGSPAYVAKAGDTMTGALVVYQDIAAPRIIADGPPPGGGNVTLRNLGKTGDAANAWELYNMTGAFGDSFQIWSYAANASSYGPRFILGDDGTTVLGPSGGNVGIGKTPSATLDVAGAVAANGLRLEGDAALNDHVLRLRSAEDPNHGLGWSGPGRPFAGVPDIEGPVLYGYNSGALGTTITGEKVVLRWNHWGWVGITGGLQTPDVQVSGTTRTGVLEITGGADVAEPFPVSGQEIPKGAVVVIDEENPGRLRLSAQAYDTRVAGIVSGANGIQPGLTLSQQGVMEGGQNVALSGRVYVQADASRTPIKPGDLLTTSDVPGHAMKVTDFAKAQGAVLGKAMSGLTEGRGIVLVLVSLQ
jgi:hypothetical protein